MKPSKFEGYHGIALILVAYVGLFIAVFTTGCATDEPTNVEPYDPEPEVAGQQQALTATVKLSAVLTHFGLPTYYLEASPGTSLYRVRLDKQLFVKIGDSAYFEVKSGYWAGTPDAAAVEQLCIALSGHKVYLRTNGVYNTGLNLEGRLVVR